MGEIPNWFMLLAASAAGFMAGITLTVASRCRIALSIGGRTLELPRWAVLVGASGAALSIVATMLEAIADPTWLHVGVALVILALFTLACIGIEEGVRHDG